MEMQDYDAALKEANKEWNGVLSRLWVAFGKPVDPAQFKVYRDTLNKVPLGVLEHVVEQTIKRHKYNTVPPLATVNEVLNELQPDYRDEVYLHTRPHFEDAQRRRMLAVDYPRAVDQYREWVTGRVDA
jgi:hypothetical protein